MITLGMVLTAVSWVFSALRILIFINVIMSWIPPLRNGIIGKIVSSVVDPILYPIRALVAKSPLGGSGMPLDFSPVIVLILLSPLEIAVQYIIITLAQMIG